MEKDVRILAARLLAHQYLPRQDRLVRKALTEESFRLQLDVHLHGCGLKLIDNPYAEHVSLALERDMEQPVMGEKEGWLSNTLGLDRSALALLVVVWALIVLPKRQRQIERKQLGDDMAQAEMFAQDQPLPVGRCVSAPLNRNTLIADYGEKLGRATRIRMNLGTLARLGFIVQRQDEIHEGPLLDLLFDYTQLAGRVLDGALADLLGRHLGEILDARSSDDEEEDEADV